MSVADIRAQWARARFVWGKTDCMMSVSNYVWAATGVDPAAPWRGTYSDEAGALAICEAHGGALGVFRYGMGLAGFSEAPRGVLRPVVCQVGGQQVAGIDVGRRVLFMADGRGMVEMPADVVGAWSL